MPEPKKTDPEHNENADSERRASSSDQVPHISESNDSFSPESLLMQELDSVEESSDSSSPEDQYRVPSNITEEHETREQRLPCSFPGLMKILVPEKSFVPTSLAVRVANISATGAMVEVHDKSKLGDSLALANRFFELKVAHPEIPIMRGLVAWSDLSVENPVMGLSCFERIEELGDIVLSASDTKGFRSPPPLPPPKLIPYPPLTEDLKVTIEGEAAEALEVIAKGDEGKIAAEIRNGKFILSLQLKPNSENHFSLRSFAGQRRSRAVPIRISQISARARKPSTHQPYFDLKESVTAEEIPELEIEFNGKVQAAERILYRISQLMTSSDHVNISMTLEARSGFDFRLINALCSEGKMVQGDTTKSNQAAEFLKELL